MEPTFVVAIETQNPHQTVLAACEYGLQQDKD